MFGGHQEFSEGSLPVSLRRDFSGKGGDILASIQESE